MRSLCILILLLFPAVWYACSDSNNEDGLKMSVNKNSILATGADEAKLSVTYNGADVTSGSVIKEQSTGETLVNGVFITSIPGTYSFIGEYSGMKTEPLTITAEKGEGYKKNILTMKFTAIGCHTCPEATKAIREAGITLPGRVYPIAIYGTLGEMKDFMIEEYVNSFKKYFQFNEYPTVMIDHVDKWSYQNGVKDVAFEKALKAKGEIGIALETNWNGDVLNVKVKIKGSKTIDFPTNLVVTVLESDLYAVQTGALTEEDNYHDHVVRKYLTDLYGDEYRIEKNVLKSSEEYVRSFQYTAPAEFKKANLEIMVYLLKTSDKAALNCQTVEAGKNMDYEKF